MCISSFSWTDPRSPFPLTWMRTGEEKAKKEQKKGSQTDLHCWKSRGTKGAGAVSYP